MKWIISISYLQEISRIINPRLIKILSIFHSNRGPQRRGAGIKTDGNIARLSADDDDDENNTWNGNSTQQM